MNKVSFIIPTLNEFKRLRSCLLRLKGLHGEYEVIVVDGGSQDKTHSRSVGLVNAFIRSEQGRALQMNVGADKATGDILVFLHADTRVPENVLSLIVDAMESGAAWGRFDVELEGEAPMLKWIARMMNYRSAITHICTGDQVMFMRQQVFKQVGGFPAIALMEDIAISKLLKKIAKPYRIKEPVVSSGRRWEKSGVWRTILLMWSLRLRYFFGTSPDKINRLYRNSHFFGS